ncbi:hypothetical protein RHMOL_Rhmol08G0084900 [Rhododendron molle]|uniref:Uncharacterized protein n=1 Tax=Rhododendron molle TaxID=49168 RepID=A0ACC0ML65_RHOML|nr:hypothetical protein RHMOL_Rhmol08G0084900 [Rhododendron molle]
MQPQFSPRDGNLSSPGRVSSSSASSSTSSFDPFLDVDDDENDILDTSTPKYGQDSPISPISVVKSAAEWSMISASPMAGPHSPHTPEWSMHGASPKQSPPIQTMGWPGPNYDPSRIPSSIFASKPANPMDWSVASNDSLFSIHMGNNSFKSGELTTVMEVAGENHGRSDSMREDSPGKQMEDEKTKEVVTTEKTEDLSKESVARMERVGFSFFSAKLSGEILPVDGARTCASTPRLSYGSGNSSRSFAFPVFTREGGGSGSVRVTPDISQSKLPETPQSQPQALAATPKPAETRCLLLRILILMEFIADEINGGARIGDMEIIKKMLAVFSPVDNLSHKRRPKQVSDSKLVLKMGSEAFGGLVLAAKAARLAALPFLENSDDTTWSERICILS